jgi:SAM-dependent methyltransferase
MLSGWRSLRFLADQFRPVPSPATTESQQRRAYARVAELHAFEQHAASGLYESEIELLDAGHLRAGDSLLDIGCGIGREAFGFAERGLRVTAIDPVPEMIARAEQLTRGRDVRFVVMSIASLRFEPSTFDAVYVSSDVYQKTPGRTNRVSALSALRAVVRPGGTIVFAASVAVRRSPRVRWLVEAPRSALRRWFESAVAEPGDAFYRDGNGPPVYHHVFHDEAEILDEVRDAGLLPVARFGSFFVTHAPGGPDRYRPAPHVSVATYPDGLLIADIGSGVSYRTNASGAAFWTRVSAGATVDEAADALANELRVPRDRLARDAESLIAALVRQRLLERVESS